MTSEGKVIVEKVSFHDSIFRECMGQVLRIHVT